MREFGGEAALAALTATLPDGALRAWALGTLDAPGLAHSALGLPALREGARACFPSPLFSAVAATERAVRTAADLADGGDAEMLSALGGRGGASGRRRGRGPRFPEGARVRLNRHPGADTDGPLGDGRGEGIVGIMEHDDGSDNMPFRVRVGDTTHWYEGRDLMLVVRAPAPAASAAADGGAAEEGKTEAEIAAAAAAAAKAAAAKAARAGGVAELAAKTLLLRLVETAQASSSGARAAARLIERALEVCGRDALLSPPPPGGGGGGGGGGDPLALSPLADRIFTLLFSAPDKMGAWALCFAQLLAPDVRPAFLSRLALRGDLKRDMALTAEALNIRASGRYTSSGQRCVDPGLVKAMLLSFALLLEHAPGAKAAAATHSETRRSVFRAAAALETHFPVSGSSEEEREVQRLLAHLLRVFLA
jgi:hypothetical protein